MKLITKLKALMPTKRKLIQLYFALLFNVNFKGFFTGNIYQGNTKKFCVPGINCYSCPGAIGACPLGSFQGSFSADRSTIYYVCGILALYGILLGRWICGWLCPFGFIQELLHKIKSPKVGKSPVTKVLSWAKYVILVFFVFIVPITYAIRDVPLPAFCKYICPAGTLEGGLGLLSNKVNASYFAMLGPLFTWKFLLLVSICVGSIFIFRLFCRFICPLGALYGLFNRFSFFGIRVDNAKCTHCNLCVTHCKVDIRHPGDQECISCGECIGTCPTEAISWKGPKILLRRNETNAPEEATTTKKRNISRIVTALLMAAILVGAAVYYWNAGPTATEGSEPGDLCYGYDLQLIDETGILTQTVNPAKSGKITIINFWGTWCTPCVNELPYFDRIASEYADTVRVIAIHTNMINNTAPGFIGNNYPDSPILFASDYVTEGSTTEQYYTTLGGRGTYPYTVILDTDGIIHSIFVEPLTYEDLKAVVEALS